ncbi:MAG: hypothetical protein E7Z97_06135 [Propionibacteriaceae bacterium]|nr:hypothetical protein [Propionibacteriaceae bacterium]
MGGPGTGPGGTSARPGGGAAGGAVWTGGPGGTAPAAGGWGRPVPLRGPAAGAQPMVWACFAVTRRPARARSERVSRGPARIIARQTQRATELPTGSGWACPASRVTRMTSATMPSATRKAARRKRRERDWVIDRIHARRSMARAKGWMMKPMARQPSIPSPVVRSRFPTL